MNERVKSTAIFSPASLSVAFIFVAEHKFPRQRYLVGATFADGSNVNLTYENSLEEACRGAASIARKCGVPTAISMRRRGVRGD
jgi:hypothetical protein